MDRRFRILAVDDEFVNTQLLKSVLSEEYDIITSLNGYETIDLIEQHKPDIILLDVMMQDLNGFDICKIIKSDERYADIPVIFLTAMDTSEGALQGLDIGAIDYIAKPVNIELLKLRVRNHIALKINTDTIRDQRDLLVIQKRELEEALARVKQLEGIIPICMYCKKIRDDQQTWFQLEEYITQHSEALFSHGICPNCLEEQYKINSIVMV